MTAAHDRAASRERQAARALGTERVHRARGERAPDVYAVELPGGEVLQAEVKTRKRLPSLLLGALAQARRYNARAVPCAVVSQKGGRALVCLPLEDFARLLGLAPERLPSRPRVRRGRVPQQLDLLAPQPHEAA